MRLITNNALDNVPLEAVARVKAIDAARPEWWSAPLPDLIALALNEPATPKRMEKGLNEAKRTEHGDSLRFGVAGIARDVR